MKSKKVLVMMVAALLATPSMAAVVFSDDFSDGNRDGWYMTSGGILTVTDDSAGIGTGDAVYMQINSGSTQRRLVTNFSVVELTNVGDSISLSFDFRIAGTGDSLGGFRFGLFDSNGTLQELDATSGSSSSNAFDDKGYFAAMSVGIQNRTQLQEDKASGTSFMGGTDLTTHATDDLFGGINDGLMHTAVFTITRQQDLNTAGEYFDIPVLSLLIDGTKYLDDPDGDRASPLWIFNEIGLSGSNSICDFVVDNVNVTFTPVPEPATMCILAFGGMLAMLQRKRS